MADVRSIAERFEKALANAAVSAGEPVLVACSGGPDSVLLADLTCELHRSGRLGSVTLAYIDHGLRDDSAADGEMVGALAARNGAAARVVAVEVDRARPSLEEAARDARYAALDQLADEVGAARVFLGHTASDQAETVIMRILRGSGVVGLAGIPVARGRYVRPLLEVTRAEVEAMVTQRGLDTARDSMNEDPSFLRNRVRHQILPQLRRENPQIDAAFCRLAGAASEQREILDFAAERLAAAADLTAADGKCNQPVTGARIAVAPLAAAPNALAKRAMALLAERVGGGPLEARHQAALLDLLGREECGTTALDLPGLRAVREYDCLRLVRAAAAPPPIVPAVEVRGCHEPHEVRLWKPGDRMRPARLKGRSRKLSDLFTDAKVPREKRARAVVVVRAADGVIIWAQHVGAAHGVAVNVTLTT